MATSAAAARKRHRRIGAGLLAAALLGAALISDQRGLLAQARHGGHPAPMPMPSAFAAIVPPALPLPDTSRTDPNAAVRHAFGGAGFQIPAADGPPHSDVQPSPPDALLAFAPAPPAVDPAPLALSVPTLRPADLSAIASLAAPTIRTPALAQAAAAVPEPASWMTMIAGFAMLGLAGRRARASKAC